MWEFYSLLCSLLCWQRNSFEKNIEFFEAFPGESDVGTLLSSLVVGLTEALQKLTLEKDENTINILLVGSGDCRHVLKTIAQSYRWPKEALRVSSANGRVLWERGTMPLNEEWVPEQ